MPSGGELCPRMGEGEWGWLSSMFGKVSLGSPCLGKLCGIHEGCSRATPEGFMAGVQSKSTGAGVLQAEAGAASLPEYPFIASHGCSAARNMGANTTSLLQPIILAFWSRE